LKEEGGYEDTGPARRRDTPQERRTCRHALEAGCADGLDHKHLLQLALVVLTEAVGQALVVAVAVVV